MQGFERFYVRAEAAMNRQVFFNVKFRKSFKAQQGTTYV